VTSPPAAELRLTTESSDHTERLGEIIGAWLRPGDVILLHGDLGAGKTTLTKGIARVLGVQDTVASPSFALVNEYALPLLRLFHLDLYRLDDPADLESIGFAELTSAEDGIAIVEWPERAGTLLPDRYLLVEIMYAGEDRRDVRLGGAPASAWLERLPALESALASFQPA
jgi:tRNA threonylcarbamoyl adenosine modification protein YjeE